MPPPAPQSFPPVEPLNPKISDFGMLIHMTDTLTLGNPCRKYPPYGVPCPRGVNCLQLSLKREEWWGMLQRVAWEERRMFETNTWEKRMEFENEVEEKAKGESGRCRKGDGEKMGRKDSFVGAREKKKKDGEREACFRGCGSDEAICDDSDDEVEAESERDITQKKEEERKRGLVEENDGQRRASRHGHRLRRARPLCGLRGSGVAVRKGSKLECG